MEQLSGLDANFLYVERPGMPQHIGGVSIYAPGASAPGQARFNALRELVAARLHYSPVFTRKLAPVPLGLGQPWWTRDDAFDLDNHLHHCALPAPGDWAQLCTLAAHEHERPLHRDRPLWELTLIEGIDQVPGIPEGSFALQLKVHHATMDGVHGPAFLGTLHDLAPGPKARPAVEPEASPVPQAPSTAGRVLRAYRDGLRLPGRAAGLLREAAGARRRLRRIRPSGGSETPPAPTTRFQGRIDGDRVVDACIFDFASVRAIKQAVPDTTINDVMLAIVAGGLRRYLEEKDELPELSLRAACPMDVRVGQEGDGRTNVLSLLNISLATAIDDPLARLEAIAGNSERAKAEARALGTGLSTGVMETVPAPLQALAIQGAEWAGLMEYKALCNTVVSNVPGAPVQLYLLGSPMIAGFSLGPLMPNIGLFHTIYSAVQDKRGTLTLSITACRQMLPDPARYTACLEDSYRELARAAGLPASKRQVRTLRSRRRRQVAGRRQQT